VIRWRFLTANQCTLLQESPQNSLSLIGLGSAVRYTETKESKYAEQLTQKVNIS
jgi:hypothetical protein